MVVFATILSSNSASAQWKFKRQIKLINHGEKVNDAVLQIQLSTNEFDYSTVKTDGADIRFSLGENVSVSPLSYWIEEWNHEGLTSIWVKIPVLKAKEKITLTMFYGNSSAFPVSSGERTFLFFDDFDSKEISSKWTNVSIGQVQQENGVLKLKEDDGQDGMIIANFNLTGKMIVRTMYQRENGDEHWTRAGIGGWNHFFCFGDHTDFAGTGTNYLMFYGANSLSSLKTSPAVKTGNGIINSKWRPTAFWYDGENLNGKQDEVTVKWSSNEEVSKLSLRTLDNDAWDNFAYVTVSPYTGSDLQITVGKQENVKIRKK